MFSADQVVLHLVGDYITQTDWMATEKTKRFFPAFIHVIIYSAPFLIFLHASYLALTVIFLSHILIDRYRLARYLLWARSWLFDRSKKTWSECQVTGFPPERPIWLTVWLMIITDNIIHILINGFALYYL